MRKTFDHLSLVFMVTSLFGTNSPSYAQSVERPAYVIVATMTPRGEAVLQNISGRLSTKGFKTKIAPVGDRIALLVGPYTSPDDFNLAVESVTAVWREPAQRAPFFFENAPLSASGPQEHVSSSTVQGPSQKIEGPGFDEALEWLNTRFANVLGDPTYFFEGSLYNVSFTRTTMSYSIAGKSSIQTEGDTMSDGSPRGHYIYPHTNYTVSFGQMKTLTSTDSGVTIKGRIHRCSVSGYRDDSPDCDDIAVGYVPLKDVDGSSGSILSALKHMGALNGATFVNDNLFGR